MKLYNNAWNDTWFILLNLLQEKVPLFHENIESPLENLLFFYHLNHIYCQLT